MNLILKSEKEIGRKKEREKERKREKVRERKLQKWLIDICNSKDESQNHRYIVYDSIYIKF